MTELDEFKNWDIKTDENWRKWIYHNGWFFEHGELDMDNIPESLKKAIRSEEMQLIMPDLLYFLQNL